MSEKNFAYIDWQNLHFWTKSKWWKIDLFKFRIYLKDKFNVEEAYYFLWCVDESLDELYTDLQKAGFIVIFREHSNWMKGKKKWNVDTDIVYEIMKCSYENLSDKIVLVSWDWDYIKTVKHLIKHKKLKKILFPNNNYSSLYNLVGNWY